MATIHHRYINEHIILLELDHPPANSLSKKMKIQFATLLDEIEQNEKLRVVIITGRGDKFCCGDDLKEAIQNAAYQEKLIQNLRDFSAVVNRVEALNIPTIAAINGWCIGGGVELALCCDLRLATQNAKLITAGINVGLMASTYRLPRLIGQARAKRMLLTAEPIDAQTALDYGLVTDIFSSEELLPQAIKMAESIAQKAPLAVKAAKNVSNITFHTSPEEMKILAQEILEQLAHSKDHKEALQAFKEKRTPNFKGD